MSAEGNRASSVHQSIELIDGDAESPVVQRAIGSDFLLADNQTQDGPLPPPGIAASAPTTCAFVGGGWLAAFFSRPVRVALVVVLGVLAGALFFALIALMFSVSVKDGRYPNSPTASAHSVWCASMATVTTEHSVRQVVRLVAALNLFYFGVEFAVARLIGSVSLFADSIDFLEDASVNFLILAALGWTARKRAYVAMALAGILLVPGLSTLWTAWDKFNLPLAPNPTLLSLTGAGALIVNLSCALMLPAIAVTAAV
jgi:hypothetical protein